MHAYIKKIRDDLLATEDTVCLQRAWLVTEAYREHADDPQPVKRARAFAHVLRNMDLDVDSNPIFAGNTSSRPRAWMLIPEHGFANDAQVLLENEGLDDILEGQIPPELAEYWDGRSFGGACGIGHLAVDLNSVVHEGFEALIERVRASEDAQDPARQIYREAMQIALQAVIDWAQRYAEAAKLAASEQTNPEIRAAHLRVAEACRHVPAKPARNLFEGLQAIALTQLAVCIEGHGMSVSTGLPDRVLAPFVTDDFDAHEATGLIAAYMLKITANSLFGRGSKTQAITVGGADHTGRDCSNPLTMCFLDACDLVRVGDPHLFVRWHEGISPKLKERALEMLAAGVSMPLLINDAPTAQGFINAGVAPPDAWEYCVIGCNELGIPGKLMQSATAMAGSIQQLALLNRVLLDHPDPDAIGSLNDLLSLVEGAMLHQARQMRGNGFTHWERMAESVPTPFTSALMEGCIEKGRDLLTDMKYRIPGLYERGITNAANAFAAIEHLVFEEHTMSLSGLVGALQDDLADAQVRTRLLSSPKWGNDDERADHWALELVRMRERVLDQVDSEFGHSAHTVCHVVRSLHHLDGKRIAASPDGRYAWTPVADSVGAHLGTARRGPTGVLNSVLKLDYPTCYRGGYNLNITLAKADTTPESLKPLVETFFARGGQELQINCLDAATLARAQQHPEDYGDLVVRLAGLSARFVDLSRIEQDELIERAETTV